MKKLTILLALLLFFTSCGKKEEGAADGKKSKTEKVAKAADLTEAQISEALAEIIGSSDSWQIAFFKGLKQGMPSAEVKKIYPDLVVDDSEEYDFPEVEIKDNKIVASIKFTFTKGKLDSGTLLFKEKLNKEAFKKASLAAFEAKWGKLKEDERNEDILTAANSKFQLSQRMYMVDHWELRNDIVE